MFLETAQKTINRKSIYIKVQINYKRYTSLFNNESITHIT